MMCFLLRLPEPMRSAGAILAGLALLLLSTPVFAELMVYPTRLIIEGNQRATKVELINNGSEVATYRITLVNRRMNETGAFSDIEEPLPGELFSDALLRYSPRQITLAPGAGQTVRLMVRKPANLEPGEYRSHLLFSKQPSVAEARAPDSIKDAVGVRIKTLVGVSIPVIVRHGDTGAQVKLTDVELTKEGNRVGVSFLMERTGNQSVYGDIVVTFQPDGRAKRVVGRANGVAVYTPNSRRRASLLTGIDAQASLSGGTLQVIFKEQAEDNGHVLAQESLAIP